MTAAPGTATASARFAAIGTTVGVVCTEAGELASAAAVLRTRLGELDRAASRFRADSELAVINARSTALARTKPDARLRVTVGPMLGACLRAALRAERMTGGLVSPAVGAALVACGYDDDLDAVRERNRLPGGEPTPPRPAPVGRVLLVENESRRERPAGTLLDPPPGTLLDPPAGPLLDLPAGTLLDLGACAKAWAADAIAAELAATHTGGFLVNLGGDIAVAGVLPPEGWAIGVRNWTGEVAQVVRSTGQAFATSSTRLRTWTDHGIRRHHIIDPRTGGSARTRWAQVTCAGPDAVQANTASTAAIVLDDRAPRWLAARGVPARLTTGDGDVVTTPGWPAATEGQHVS
ncbi:FAD:protein FMN transferase [Nocardia sp. BMG111209]|uniref:FAD:protein FMN transferase n=1 Tax=Nocardia sp. BMG111209 TaxID=1160137 RepID=UPI0003697B4F|nr:FAD:protein FMN transferase [Nocardia sp. BMG111209]